MYIKPTAKFRFPKGLRPLLRSIQNKDSRDIFRNNIVQAVLQGEAKLEVKNKKDSVQK